jgi:REP element-mobilizing transposase RayT
MLPAERNPRIRRVELELRASGVNRDANPLRSGIHNRGYLPHVKREGAVYFVTYRLADSLPKEVLLKFESERAERRTRFLAQHEARKRLGESVRIEEEDLEEIERDFGRQVERFLDTGCGECWLRRPEVAGLVASALRFFEGQRYRLDEWVVMPNHVHAVVWPMPNQTLSAILRSWKRFTAREANQILRRTGQPFWQPESFDHWIRNDPEHARCCRYVRMNPVNARLCSSPEEWRWSSAWPSP